MESNNKRTCGIIMPISSFADYSTDHWSAVLEIVQRSITGVGLESIPIWKDDITDIIQQRIIDRISDLPLIIIDISGPNPNVMFELGLRIALQKPLILIKDKETRCPFDIGSIDYLEYPSNLNYLEIEEFTNLLKIRIKSMISGAVSSAKLLYYIKNNDKNQKLEVGLLRFYYLTCDLKKIKSRLGKVVKDKLSRTSMTLRGVLTESNNRGKNNHLSYGPYDALPIRGSYKANFSLKLNNHPEGLDKNTEVLILDVYDYFGGRKVLSSRVVKLNDLNMDAYISISINFKYENTNQTLEYRVELIETGVDVSVEYIRVERINE